MLLLTLTKMSCFHMSKQNSSLYYFFVVTVIHMSLLKGHFPCCLDSVRNH